MATANTMGTTRTGNFTIGFRRGWSDWQKDTAALAQWARDNEFGVIDLGREAVDEAAAVQQARLAVGTADMVDWGALMSADDGKRREAVAHNTEHIEKCAALGITRFFIVLLPEDPARARRDNFASMIESMGELAPVLERASAAVVIEGYPGPGALGCTPADCRALFEAVPSPAMALNYDPSHLIRMGIDPIRFLREFAARVRHVHAKDTELYRDRLDDFGWEQPATFAERVPFSGTTWRYTLPGHGECRWVESFRLLHEAGYDGYVCIELEDANFNGSEQGEKQGLIFSRQFLESC